MKPQKRLALRREAMTDLRSDELGSIVAAGFEVPPSLALCQFTAGQSCGGVCSGYCPSFTCPAAEAIEAVRNQIITVG